MELVHVPQNLFACTLDCQDRCLHIETLLLYDYVGDYLLIPLLGDYLPLICLYTCNIILFYHVMQSSSYKYIREIKCPVTILDFYFVKMPWPVSEKSPNQYCNKLGKSL